MKNFFARFVLSMVILALAALTAVLHISLTPLIVGVGVLALASIFADVTLNRRYRRLHKRRLVMKRYLLNSSLMLVLLGLAFVPMIAHAQDTTLPPAAGDVTATLAAALEMLTKVVAAVTALPFTVGFVTAATALVKRYIPESLFSGGAIALFFQVIAWVVWVLALHFGFGAQFQTWISALTTVIGAVGGLVASSYAATKIYNAAAVAGVPFLGYSRSPSTLIMAKKNALFMSASKAA